MQCTLCYGQCTPVHSVTKYSHVMIIVHSPETYTSFIDCTDMRKQCFNECREFPETLIRHHLLLKKKIRNGSSYVSFIGLYLQLIFLFFILERNALDKFLGWLLSLLFIALNFSVQTVDSREMESHLWNSKKNMWV